MCIELMSLIHYLDINNNQMSYFKIQRKLTEISPKIKSIQKKHHFSKSPKRMQTNDSRDNIMRRRMTTRQTSEQSHKSKEKQIELDSLLMKQGMKAYKQKNIDKALEYFKEIYKNNRRSAELAYYIGSCLLNQKKHQASIMYFNNCLLYDPLYSQYAYLYLSVNFKLLQNIRQAIKALHQGLQKFPVFEEGLFYKGKLHMKLGQYQQAIKDFNKCICINSKHDLAMIFLADCFKAQGKMAAAIQKYKKIMQIGRKHSYLASLRMIQMLVDKQSFEQALIQIDVIDGKLESAELNYYKGIVHCQLGRKSQGIVYLEISLTTSKQMGIAVKALKGLIYIFIQQHDFFGAEYRISKAIKMGIAQEPILEWKLLIEGVNDMIKRKNYEGMLIIRKSIDILISKQKNKKLSVKQILNFKRCVYSYYAYALFINKYMTQSVQIYEIAISYKHNSKDELYNSHITRGIIFYLDNKYNQAYEQFNQAFIINQRIESLFLNSINLVQQYKYTNKDKDDIFEKAISFLKTGQILSSKNSLMMFYYSLVMLELGINQLDVIDSAIQMSQQPVSEYYFIRALTLFNGGKLQEALLSMTKAIQIDQNVQQFYKQRSKYYFIVQQYQMAIQDCKKAKHLIEQDEQIDILLTFYYYLNNQYEDCYKYLKVITMNDNQGKYKPFEQALMMRMGYYTQIGPVGQLISNLSTTIPLHSDILLTIQAFIIQRQVYSEFSVYLYHLLLSVYYAKVQNYDLSFNHLVGCLNEIRAIIDQKQCEQVGESIMKEVVKQKLRQITVQQTQNMLNEVKFNIVLVSLMKNNLQEAQNCIRVFINQTDSLELKQTFIIILKMIKHQSKEANVQIILFQSISKISDEFMPMCIKVNETVLNTRMTVFYPIKLKFSISPEFDPSYLYNFDIDKIEHKLLPPWLKNNKQIMFTDHVYIHSAIVSETQRSDSQIKSFTNGYLKDQFQLDYTVQAKLKPIIHNK